MRVIPKAGYMLVSDIDVLAQGVLGNPADLVQIDSGGVNQEAMMFGVHARSLFSYLAGGMDGFGGLSPQAPTLGQEQMLAQSSSRILVRTYHAAVIKDGGGSEFAAGQRVAFEGTVHELCGERMIHVGDIVAVLDANGVDDDEVSD